MSIFLYNFFDISTWTIKSPKLFYFFSFSSFSIFCKHPPVTNFFFFLPSLWLDIFFLKKLIIKKTSVLGASPNKLLGLGHNRMNLSYYPVQIACPFRWLEWTNPQHLRHPETHYFDLYPVLQASHATIHIISSKSQNDIAHYLLVLCLVHI